MAGVKGKSGRKKKPVDQNAKIKCSVCGTPKDPGEFYSNKARKSARQTVCKECNPIVAFEASCRRAIKSQGSEAFRKKIASLEDRATLMRRILLKWESNHRLTEERGSIHNAHEA